MMGNSATSILGPSDIYMPLLKEAYQQMITAYTIICSDGYQAKGENQIRDDIVREAEKLGCTGQPFMYITEHRELKEGEANTRIDIKLVNALTLNEGGDRGITVECKIVGEQKYINSNGISSFVSGKYAAGKPLAGMMGFIKSGVPAVKIEKVKELLSKHTSIQTVTNLEPYQFSAGFNYGYHSEHIRTDKSSVQIYHLFFDLVDKKKA